MMLYLLCSVETPKSEPALADDLEDDQSAVQASTRPAE